MELKGRNAVVTGAAGGIGAAIAAALYERGARVLLADLDEAVADTAGTLSQPHWTGDVSSADGVTDLVDTAERELGQVDLYFANAGIGGATGLGGEGDWDRILDVNLRAHIRAAERLVPQWTVRGEGYFVATASAAGLLTQIGQAGYSVTKHAALAFAEWLSVTYGDEGLRVSVLAPMGVNTKILWGDHPDAVTGTALTGQRAVAEAGNVLEPADVATTVMAAIEAETFLILPHPEVLDMYRMKGSDYDRWIRGMRRYQAKLQGS
ncbi:SDR family oxidoreductase [Brevibacterium aurantiacum]|uniref:SDR family oxidoreductase n=1 Tax=Brevibacterium aurantiacum TaxID=273384 RepID=A0A4Z0KLA9_BREAU|nr:SDR family oxidoreductase [Brevibacterium aurantiacum]TGD38448.1 SDR family oxidoreductase [Brevibacterium aurantiacum]